MTVIDIPLTEAERMQARSHAFKMAVLRWSMFGLLLALALLTCGSPASDRAAAAEAALREGEDASSRLKASAVVFVLLASMLLVGSTAVEVLT